MNDSFVFYKSFYKAITLLASDSEKWEIIQALCELAYSGNDADLDSLSDMQKVVYFVASEQIKASVQHKLDGAKGGRPRKDTKDKTGVKTPLLTPLNTNVNVNVNDNVNVNGNANIENCAPSFFTGNQTNYSKQIFELFKNAGLPCARNNEISFLQTDFANAMRYLHSTPEFTNLHSNDCIQAVKNYIEVLKDNTCYVSQKMNFVSLVKSKLFYNLLPSNFVIENYKNYKNIDSNGNSIPTEERDENGQKKLFEVCPKCKLKKIWYSNALQKFTCDNCHHVMKWEEFYNDN